MDLTVLEFLLQYVFLTALMDWLLQMSNVMIETQAVEMDVQDLAKLKQTMCVLVNLQTAQFWFAETTSFRAQKIVKMGQTLQMMGAQVLAKLNLDGLAVALLLKFAILFVETYFYLDSKIAMTEQMTT